MKNIMKRLLDIKEAAQYLGISERTLYNRIAPKAQNPFPIKVKRVGKSVRFDLEDLKRFVDSL